MRGGQEEKKPQKMVRSSIACARCRRSKVKCKSCATYLWDEGSLLGKWKLVKFRVACSCTFGGDPGAGMPPEFYYIHANRFCRCQQWCSLNM